MIQSWSSYFSICIIDLEGSSDLIQIYLKNASKKLYITH